MGLYPESPAGRREEMGKFRLGLGNPLPPTFGGQGWDWASEALLPGGLRSGQQYAPNAHPTAELLGVTA